jgi:hypothetical protein
MELGQQRDWSIAPRHIHFEPGRSAKTDARPAFQRMMRQAQARQFDYIVVHKLDRFSHSLSDVVKNVALLKKADVGLVSISEPWVDTTTPQGEFMLHLFALLAHRTAPARPPKARLPARVLGSGTGRWHSVSSSRRVRSIRKPISARLVSSRITWSAGHI